MVPILGVGGIFYSRAKLESFSVVIWTVSQALFLTGR